MVLTDSDLQIIKQYGLEAATKAASYIFDRFSTEVSVTKKEDTGGTSLASQVVTEVDIRAQEIILDSISPTFAQFDLGLLTEESPDDNSRFTKDYFWCVDPMDGTLAFTKKEEGFSVALSLVSKVGEPIIGIVAEPISGDFYYAIKGKGVFKNEKEFVVAKNNRFILFNDRSFPDHFKSKDYIASLEKFLGKAVLVGTTRGSVLNAIKAMEHSNSCYFKPVKATKGGGCIWDFAATACIAKELGSELSNSKGEILLLNEKDPFMNKQGVLFSWDIDVKNQIINMLDV